jgi:hypothetical protein
MQLNVPKKRPVSPGTRYATNATWIFPSKWTNLNNSKLGECTHGVIPIPKFNGIMVRIVTNHGDECIENQTQHEENLKNIGDPEVTDSEDVQNPRYHYENRSNI